MPVGMYVAQTPSQPRSDAPGTTCRSSAGAGSTVSMNATLSSARLRNSTGAPGAAAPSAPVAALSARPPIITRRGSKRSASEPPTRPSSAEPARNSETIQLTWTSDRPNSCCRTGSAGGSLPTLSAATIPAPTSTIARPIARSLPAAVMSGMAGMPGCRDLEAERASVDCIRAPDRKMATCPLRARDAHRGQRGDSPAMSLPPILKDKLRLPVVGAPLFIISNPDLVVAQCKAGIVGSFPALNARPAEQLEAWLDRITSELAEHDRRHPDRPAAPFAVNQIVHRSNDRLDHDLALCVKYRVPIVITSLGARVEVNDAIHGYGGIVLHDIINDTFAHKAIDKGADGLIAVAA